MSNAQDVRHILVVEDQKSKRIVTLTETAYSLGRDPNSSIVIYDRQVSRHHATLLRVTDYQSQQDFYRVIDGDLQGKRSTNGIMVNGKYSLSHELRPGDTIRFGSKALITYRILTSFSEIEGLENSARAENLTGLLTFVSSEQDTEQTEDVNTNLIVSNSIEEERLFTPFGKASTVEGSPHPIIEFTPTGVITYLNPAALERFSDLRSRPEDYPILQGVLGQFSSQGEKNTPREVVIGDGVFEQYNCYLESEQLIRSYFVEITKHKEIENRLASQQDYYQLILEQMTEGVFLVDARSKQIIETNLAYCKLLGYKVQDLLGRDLYQLIALDREAIDRQLESIEPEKPYYVEESLHRCIDGLLVSVEEKITRSTFRSREIFCFTVRNISERKRSEEKLQYQSFHDSLTNLPNRLFFDKKLTFALTNAQRNKTLLAVIFLDIDSFKNINNVFGHAIGDRVLQDFSQRLLDCLRSGDTIARWGSDEFTILLPRIRNPEDTIRLASRIFETLKEPFVMANHQLQVKTSMGIAIYPQDGEQKENLLKNADTALYRCKAQGRNQYQFYKPILSEEAELFLKLETSLHQAIDKQEFSLQYQPQVNLGSGKITGIEALLRWDHPTIGAIAPGKFLPLAEKTDLLLHIGKWVLTRACEQARSWQKDGLRPIPIGVNLSNVEFSQPNLVEAIARILEKTGLDPQWLEIEITEKTLRQNLQSARQIFQDLQNLGVRLALDDFGSGYSALGYLKQFAFRTIKLDQHFIRDLRGSPQEKAIITSVIALGQGFNFRIVAEGVETQQQIDFLRSLGCEEVQGYHFSPPLTTEAASQFLDDRRSARIQRE